jgi:hypothetical protein
VRYFLQLECVHPIEASRPPPVGTKMIPALLYHLQNYKVPLECGFFNDTCVLIFSWKWTDFFKFSIQFCVSNDL